MELLKITGKSLSQMCRLCLSLDKPMNDIFWFSSELGKEIADTIMECAPVQINRHDEMPRNICQLCFTQLKNFHQFQMQAVRSDRTLQRYLRQLNDCNPQIHVESTLVEQANISESQNYDADVTIKDEPFEISGESNNLYSKEKVLANFSSVNKVNDEISLKLEIKDEPIDDNSLIPTTCADAVENLSLYGGSEISCKDSMIEVRDAKVEYFECSVKFENDIAEKMSLAKEETYMPLNEDGNSLFSENVKDVEYPRSNEDRLNGTENPIKHKNLNKKSQLVRSVLLEKSTSTARKTHQCDICQKNFKYASELKKHNLIHTGEKPYQCDICKMCFRRYAHLKGHKLKHTGEKPYQCDICKTSFRHMNSFKNHKLKHTGEKPYQCDICKTCFRHAITLKNHNLKHTGEKPHQCDICQMCFRCPRSLSRHNLIHTGEKSYPCDICQMCFRHALSLKRHKLMHTGEKPYQCDICQTRFRQLTTLMTHNLKHTREKP